MCLSTAKEVLEWPPTIATSEGIRASPVPSKTLPEVPSPEAARGQDSMPTTPMLPAPERHTRTSAKGLHQGSKKTLIGAAKSLLKWILTLLIFKGVGSPSAAANRPPKDVTSEAQNTTNPAPVGVKDKVPAPLNKLAHTTSSVAGRSLSRTSSSEQLYVPYDPQDWGPHNPSTTRYVYAL